jgi:hypothetical protein
LDGQHEANRWKSQLGLRRYLIVPGSRHTVQQRPALRWSKSRRLSRLHNRPPSRPQWLTSERSTNHGVGLANPASQPCGHLTTVNSSAWEWPCCLAARSSPSMCNMMVFPRRTAYGSCRIPVYSCTTYHSFYAMRASACTPQCKVAVLRDVSRARMFHYIRQSLSYAAMSRTVRSGGDGGSADSTDSIYMTRYLQILHCCD